MFFLGLQEKRSENQWFDLQLERARVLQETFLMPVVTYGSKIMIWKEKEGEV